MSDTKSKTQIESEILTQKIVDQFGEYGMASIGMALTMAARTLIAASELSNGKGEQTLKLFLHGSKILCEEIIERIKTDDGTIKAQFDVLTGKMSSTNH